MPKYPESLTVLPLFVRAFFIRILMIADLLLPIINTANPSKLSNLDFYIKLLDSRLSVQRVNDDRSLGYLVDERVKLFLESLGRKMEGGKQGFMEISQVVGKKRVDHRSLNENPTNHVAKATKEEPHAETAKPKFMGDQNKSLIYKYYNSNVDVSILISDLQYNLQGLDSPNVKFTNNGFSLDFLQTTPVKSMLKDIVKCGYYYVKLKAKMNKQGLLNQALYSFINDKLLGYQQLILKIGGLQNPSLMVVKTLTADWKLKLMWMLELANTPNNELLSKIEQYCQHGNHFISSISLECLQAVKLVFDSMIRQYISSFGEIEDPFDEFFIQNDLLIPSKTPSFITNFTANQILTIGMNARFTTISYKLGGDVNSVEKLFEQSSKDVVQKLIDQGLQMHLHNLAKYLLVMDGTFIKSLHENTKQVTNRFELSRILEDSMDGVVVDNLDITTLADGTIALKYDLDPLLFSRVVSESQLVKYQKLFVKLYNLYKINYHLMQEWRLFTSIISD